MPITDDPVQCPAADGAYLCVLASGSSGNCSALVLRRNGTVRAILIDAGLSPRRTFRLLAERGIRPDMLDDVLVTHLDSDHFHSGWRRQMPAHCRVRMHGRHAAIAARLGGTWRLTPFEEGFDLDPDVRVSPLLMSHDDLGVASFRVDLSGPLSLDGEATVSLGFATDLGHIHARLVEHLDRVHVLAIESNYCPVMQHASTRSAALKQRIMGGSGHLSNQEALSAALQIEPREHVVLLHLSRECNDPAIVASLHAGADYALTITSQQVPSRWVRIGTSPRGARQPSAMPRPQVVAQNLWSMSGSGA